jgi:hypothetical protein
VSSDDVDWCAHLHHLLDQGVAALTHSGALVRRCEHGDAQPDIQALGTLQRTRGVKGWSWQA